MSIKNFNDLALQGKVCHFMNSADLIEATAQGYRLRCMLKPSAELAGAYVAEVWGTDPETNEDELQGVLAVVPDSGNHTMHVVRGKTLAELKNNLRETLGNDTYAKISIEDASTAAPASWRTENTLTMELTGQGALLH